MHDVIIIGAGPTGSHAARKLAEKGHKVLVLEKNVGVGSKKCCTGIVGMECVKTFEIDEKVIIHQANSAMLYSPSGNTLHLYRPEPQAVVLDREAFDKSMVEKAQKAGVEYGFNNRVTSVETGKDRINVMVEGRGKIPAKAVIVASGFIPGLNEKLGLGGYKDYTAGAQAEIEAPLIDRVEVYFGDIAPGFFNWIVPIYPNKVKVGLLTRQEPGKYLKRILENLYKAGEIPKKDIDAEIHYGSIPLRPPTKTYGERMLAVGDAAGQVKPTTGGGIFYGLLGANIASEVLDRALKENDLIEKRLARYERAWREKLGTEMSTGYWARKIFEKLNEKQIDRLFKVIKAGGIDEAILNAEDLSFDWHGRTIKNLLKYKLVTKSFNILRMPF